MVETVSFHHFDTRQFKKKETEKSPYFGAFLFNIAYGRYQPDIA